MRNLLAFAVLIGWAGCAGAQPFTFDCGTQNSHEVVVIKVLVDGAGAFSADPPECHIQEGTEVIFVQEDGTPFQLDFDDVPDNGSDKHLRSKPVKRHHRLGLTAKHVAAKWTDNYIVGRPHRGRARGADPSLIIYPH